MAVGAPTSPQQLARPLVGTHDLDPLLERIGEARIVCLGEASHGSTSTTRGGLC